MTVKLSELREGTMIDMNNEVYYKHQIIEMLKVGDELSPMYEITKEWTADILSQAYNDESDDTESYSTPNKGELIEIDIRYCLFCEKVVGESEEFVQLDIGILHEHCENDVGAEVQDQRKW